jgi:hypothetical protein
MRHTHRSNPNPFVQIFKIWPPGRATGGKPKINGTNNVRYYSYGEFKRRQRVAHTIDTYFREVKERGASDLHMVVGFPPLLRLGGELVKTDHPVLTAESNREILFEMLSAILSRTKTWIWPINWRETPGSAAIFFISDEGSGRCFVSYPPRS